MALNEALGETSKTLAWFDKATAERTNPKYSWALEQRVIPLLIAANRWSDAGKVYQDPLASLGRRANALDGQGFFMWAMNFFVGDVEAGLFRDDAALKG